MQPLVLKKTTIFPPLIAAPMAGISNAAWRLVAQDFGAGLAVSEMVMSRGLAEDNRKTRELASFDPREPRRAIQLYGNRECDLETAAKALADQVDLIDINFGCPVPKIFKNGCGAALLGDLPLMGRLIAATVRGAGKTPVTIKTRLGIKMDEPCYLEAGKIAESEGASAMTLHGRYAAQFYTGTADWNAIAALKSAIKIPVIGNGDVWDTERAKRIVAETHCDGVMVGRGALGRPWLLRDMARDMTGEAPLPPPTLAETLNQLRHHFGLLMETLGTHKACYHVRKWGGWYLKGFPGAAKFRARFNTVQTPEDIDPLLAEIQAKAAARNPDSGEPKTFSRA